MRCPACKGILPSPDAWVCPFCDHVLGPVEPGQSPELLGDSDEDTTLRGLAWDPGIDDEAPPPDAVILGDALTSEAGRSVLNGAGADAAGRTSTFLYYSASPSRIVRPEAVPRRLELSTAPLTPYEKFILGCVDGNRSVRHIRRLSGLAVPEVVVTLLTLLDKGLILLPSIEAQPSSLENVVDVDDLVLGLGDPGDDASAGTVPVAVGSMSASFTGSEADADDDGPPTTEIPALAALHGAPDVASSSEELEVTEDPTDLLDLGPMGWIRDELAQLAELDVKTAMERVDDSFSAASSPSPASPPPPSPPASPPLPSPPASLPLPSPPASPPPSTSPAFASPSPVQAVPAALPSLPPATTARVDPPPFESPSSDLRNVQAPVSARARVGPADGSSSPFAERSKLAVRPVSRRSVPLARPVVEVDRRPSSSAAQQPSIESPAPTAAPGRGEVRDPNAKASALSTKAAKLFESALEEEARGNLVSARMNIKLALVFEPGNSTFIEALARCGKKKSEAPKPQQRDEARELYDAATAAENRGDYDGAISCLEKALAVSKQGAFYNRLGVLYAVRKREYVRAQGLIEQAIECDPKNPVYDQNLQKVLSMAASRSLVGEKKPRGRSWFGFLRRRS